VCNAIATKPYHRTKVHTSCTIIGWLTGNILHAQWLGTESICGIQLHYSIITARRLCIVRTLLWQDVCLSICPSICHMPVLSLNGYTYPQSFFTVGYPHHSSFPHTKWDGNIPTAMGSPLMVASSAKGYEKITIFHQYFVLSRK